MEYGTGERWWSTAHKRDDGVRHTREMVGYGTRERWWSTAHKRDGGVRHTREMVGYGTQERWWGTAHERDGGTFETGLGDIAFSLTEFQVQIERNIELG